MENPRWLKMYFLLKMGDSKKYQVSFQGCRRPFHQQLPPFHQQLPYLPFISAQDFGPASPQSAAASFSAPVVPETSDNTDKKATSDSRDSCLGSYLCKSYFPSLPNTDREDRCLEPQTPPEGMTGGWLGRLGFGGSGKWIAIAGSSWDIRPLRWLVNQQKPGLVMVRTDDQLLNYTIFHEPPSRDITDVTTKVVVW